MSGLTRQEMKRDEVREWMEIAIEWVVDNVRMIVGVVVGIAVVIAAIAMILGFQRSRAEENQEALASALELYSAPVDALAANPDDEDAPTFATEADRAAAARAAFEDVRSSGDASSKRIAAVYLGTLAANAGDLEQARTLWNEALDAGGQNALTATVRLNLLSLDRQEGRHAEIVTAMEQELESASPGLPGDVILYELARALEATGEADKAQDRYQQLLDEHPGSQYALEARSRIDAG